MKLSPQEVLASLQQGNTRFWMGLATRPETSAMERRAMIMRQLPKVAILGCSDSRVPIEIVFDQGLGDVFAIRVAGNAYGTGAAASIDYAVQHLKVKVVMVLGHEGCGAVRAAQLKETEIANEPPALKEWLSSMKNAMDTKGLDNIHDARARDREAVMSNVRTQRAGEPKQTDPEQSPCGRAARRRRVLRDILRDGRFHGPGCPLRRRRGIDATAGASSRRGGEAHIEPTDGPPLLDSDLHHRKTNQVLHRLRNGGRDGYICLVGGNERAAAAAATLR